MTHYKKTKEEQNFALVFTNRMQIGYLNSWNMYSISKTTIIFLKIALKIKKNTKNLKNSSKYLILSNKSVNIRA